jgi:hypothetical protein
MTTIKDTTDSTTPSLAADYQRADKHADQPKSCSSSVEISPPFLINTVFAKSTEQRQVIVNPAQIEASLKTLERNRKLQRLQLG